MNSSAWLLFLFKKFQRKHAYHFRAEVIIPLNKF